MIFNLRISKYLSRRNFFPLEFDRYLDQDKDLVFDSPLETDNRPHSTFFYGES